MNRKTMTTLAALSLAAAAFAGAENGAVAPDAGADEHEPPWFEAGFDNDFLSAYVWRNTLQTDRPVWQPCIWGDFTRLERVWLGFSIWQNWDFTGRRTKDGLQRAMNETDFNIHLGGTAWQSDDEEYSLDIEIGNEWYTYQTKCGCSSDWPASTEFYLKTTFNNPFVNWYGQYSQAYNPVTAAHFETGLNREDNVGELFGSENDLLNRFTIGADWNINFAQGKYMTAYLYGVGRPQPPEYDEDGEEIESEEDPDDIKNGVGGTTLKANIGFEVCEHFTIGLVAAYTTVLNGDVRDGLSADRAPVASRELFWGGFQAKLSF